MADVSLRAPTEGQIEIDINQLDHVVCPQEELDPYLLKKTRIPVSTLPELNQQQTITALQKAGFCVNEVDRDAKYFVTFEMPQMADDVSDWPEPLKTLMSTPASSRRARDKSSWPDSPYIRSEGPSVQLEQFGMRQPKVSCGAGYHPPVSDGLRLHFRPAEFGHGSELDVMYEHDANETSGCCCCKKSLKVDNEWVFKSPGRENLTFRMLPEIETGPIWQLFKGESEIASIDVPKTEQLETYCFCPPRSKFPFCCGQEMAPIKPMVWLRVKAKSDYLADMISVYTIRNQDEDTDMKCCGVRIKCCWCLPQGSCDGCNPTVCTATCSAWCCTMLTCKCAYGCRKCGCGPCHLPPKGCCDPAEDVPLYSTGRGKANMLKKPGQKIMINRQGQVIGTHDVHLKYADVPAKPPMPASEMEVRFRYPAKGAQPPIPGREFHFTSRNEPIWQDEEAKKKDRWVMGRYAVKPGQTVKEGDLLGHAKKVKNCCGIPCCPSWMCCPTYCACADICRDAGCTPCAFAITACLNPGSCPCCMMCCPEVPPEFEYQQSPVTGEWATSETEPKNYRVRAEVNAIKAIGESGYLMANVEAGLESGTSECDHVAFSLVNMMEMVEDVRRPAFHVEINPPPKPSRGLPPRQQLMLAPPEEAPDEQAEE
jgi:hypothetical protein